MLCQNELRRHEKSAPAQVGKDACDIWLSDAGDNFLNALGECSGLFHQAVFLKIFKPLQGDMRFHGRLDALRLANVANDVQASIYPAF